MENLRYEVKEHVKELKNARDELANLRRENEYLKKIVSNEAEYNKVNEAALSEMLKQATSEIETIKIVTE